MGIIKIIRWLGSTLEDLKSLPFEVQNKIGYALYEAQLGQMPYCAKKFKGLNGVFELVCDFNRCTYRTICSVKHDYLYVLHVFKKKSMIGIKVPKNDIAMINLRYKEMLLIIGAE